MLYQRSLEIETRLDTALSLIRTGQCSTPDLARELGVSIPTTSRYVSALRDRGHEIRAVKVGSTWRYILEKISPRSTNRRATNLRRKPR